MATRWGIVSAGKISSDFVTALQILPKEEHQVVAVAARSLQDAQSFASKFNIGKAYGTYAELARDPDVDVAYIGAINTQHFPVAIEMMKAGKAVLCEKPLCINVRETRQLLQTAKECGVFLMEAVWSRFLPSYKELSRRMCDGEIGDVVHVIVSLGRAISHVPRVQRPEIGGGVTLDMGIYTVQLVTLVMKGDKPLKVLAGGHLNDNGVDVDISASLTYSKGRVASLSVSMTADLPSEAFIVGTKGTIKVPFPVWVPEELEGPWGRSIHPLPKTSSTFNFDNDQGLMYEAMEVRRCIKEGLLESPGMPHSESLIQAEIMEQIRMQVGTVYPQDSV